MSLSDKTYVHYPTPVEGTGNQEIVYTLPRKGVYHFLSISCDTSQRYAQRAYIVYKKGGVEGWLVAGHIQHKRPLITNKSYTFQRGQIIAKVKFDDSALLGMQLIIKRVK